MLLPLLLTVKTFILALCSLQQHFFFFFYSFSLFFRFEIRIAGNCLILLCFPVKIFFIFFFSVSADCHRFSEKLKRKYEIEITIDFPFKGSSVRNILKKGKVLMFEYPLRDLSNSIRFYSNHIYMCVLRNYAISGD